MGKGGRSHGREISLRVTTRATTRCVPGTRPHMRCGSALGLAYSAPLSVIGPGRQASEAVIPVAFHHAHGAFSRGEEEEGVGRPETFSAAFLESCTVPRELHPFSGEPSRSLRKRPERWPTRARSISSSKHPKTS
ncbi:hypothetical protein DB32_001986 [Sandaracinus amylolyticus]|uniref:Uncharacterized protein n=1 Tax=Sandaracinus amylolyticus TaxID=927083 RepID=A0A0F6W165_9BACT|nr:hypothetical protein DB32_001986 [Sandaracinus amylolyticus]